MLQIFKILADQTRLRLLRILRQGDFTVQDLMQILAMGQSRISRHLLLMSEVGLLQVEKQGTWRYYRLAPHNEFFQEIWPAIEKQFVSLEYQEEDTAAVSRIMSERRKRSQEFFDRHARDWDSLHVELLNLPDYQETLLAMLPEDGLAIELGVGSGALLPMIASKASRTIGLDQSPAMISLARETINKFHLSDRVEARLGEMNYIPCPDGSVRSVIMNQVLHHAENPGEVLKEVRRVLTDDGVLVIADLTRHEHDWARERLADQWLGFSLHELENWLEEANMYIVSYQEYGEREKQQSIFLLAAGSREMQSKQMEIEK